MDQRALPMDVEKGTILRKRGRRGNCWGEILDLIIEMAAADLLYDLSVGR